MACEGGKVNEEEPVDEDADPLLVGCRRGGGRGAEDMQPAIELRELAMARLIYTILCPITHALVIEFLHFHGHAVEHEVLLYSSMLCKLPDQRGVQTGRLT